VRGEGAHRSLLRMSLAAPPVAPACAAPAGRAA
jgi:hypothetical protein